MSIRTWTHTRALAAATVAGIVVAGCAGAGKHDHDHGKKAEAKSAAAKPAKKAAKLTDAEAGATYAALKAKMQDSYNKSGDAVARVYQNWDSFNTVAYQSATHGKRYVNNYANSVAAETYGQFPNIEQMPVGSILAKDSFKLNKKGEPVTGPLFLMEKMEAGFNESTRDWKYWAVMPNGKVMGVTNGENTKKVQFCAACHNGMGNATDAVTFLPENYRK